MLVDVTRQKGLRLATPVGSRMGEVTTLCLRPPSYVSFVFLLFRRRWGRTSFASSLRGVPPSRRVRSAARIDELQETRTVRQHEGLHILVFGKMHQGGAGLAVSRESRPAQTLFASLAH
jgi:hypothetical protein